MGEENEENDIQFQKYDDYFDSDEGIHCTTSELVDWDYTAVGPGRYQENSKDEEVVL